MKPWTIAAYFIGVAVLAVVGYVLYKRERTERLSGEFFNPLSDAILNKWISGVNQAAETFGQTPEYRTLDQGEKKQLIGFFEKLKKVNWKQALKGWEVYLNGLTGAERQKWIDGAPTGLGTNPARAKLRAIAWQEILKQAGAEIPEKVYSRAFKLILQNSL